VNKEELDGYLKEIGGLQRTYREDKGPILDAGYFGVKEGWYGIIKDLISELIENGWDRRIVQVKEKFGVLSFYTEKLPESSYDILSKYIIKSSHTCDICGKEGELRRGNWWRTRCDEHSDGMEPFDKEQMKRMFNR